jgi:5-oxoprolinase (ATP-hydrolysing)
MRERLDFSCALFDPAGQLIANAPHVPVHLGAMGESVRSIMAARGDDMRPGDAFVMNNPFNGGTHLPDITVITPVFDGADLIGFVANRGHHADIGGTTPGSTPPHSRTLDEEGVVLDNILLLRDGVLREEDMRRALMDAPIRRVIRRPIQPICAHKLPPMQGARDLVAMAARHGRAQVAAYMAHVLDQGEAEVRSALATLRDGAFSCLLDDGRVLQVSLRITDNGAQIDFTGTGPQDDGNFNAPPAVTRAVVLYALRALVGRDMPLNDGCLARWRSSFRGAASLPPHRVARGCRQYRNQPANRQCHSGRDGGRGRVTGDDEQFLWQWRAPILRNHRRRHRRWPRL